MRWPTYALGKLCDISTGRTPSRARGDYFGGENVWVTISDLNNDVVLDSKERITDIAISETNIPPVPPGTVLLGYKLSLGKLGIAGTHLYTNEAIAALPPKSNVALLNKFLLHALKRVDYVALCHGAVKGKCLNRASLERIMLPLPPITEQGRIVEILEEADSVRKKRTEADAKVQSILPACFYKMFGDPIKNTKVWPTEKLGNLCDVSRGASPRPIERYLGGSVPWIRIGDATASGEFYLHATQEHITEEGATKSVFVPEGSLILANSGVSCGFARILKISGCIHDGWLALLNIDSKLNPLFLLCYLNSITLSLRAKAPSGTQPNLNTEIVKNLQIPVPPLALQEKFASHLSILEEIGKSRRQAKLAVTKTFEALLHRAFSGDLTAKWRESHKKQLLAEMEHQSRVLTEAGARR